MSSNALTLPAQLEDRELIETLKQTVCKGASDAQFRMFIEVCRATGLNPFLKEIYFVPAVGVMAGRDGYLRKANDNPQFDGMETKVDRDDKGIPIKATCSVWRKDRSHPITCEAFYNEYNKNTDVWRKYPSAMIAKVAEVLALKRSFAINGVVTEEEIGEQGSKEAQREYLASKGLEPYKAPDKVLQPSIAISTPPGVIRELANELDQPPTIKTLEMRSAAQVAESDTALREAKKPRAKKKGAVGFDVLHHFKLIKQEMCEASGNDSAYYSVLNSFGFEKSNEITDNDKAREVYKALGAERNRLLQEKESLAMLEHASEVLGARTFAELLGHNGATTIPEALQLTGDGWQALLTELNERIQEHNSRKP